MRDWVIKEKKVDKVSKIEQIKFVYLAGPIDLAPDVERGGWRKQASEEFKKLGIGVFNPFTAYGGTINPPKVKYVKAINTRAVEISDALLIYLPKNIQTIGSIVELVEAERMEKLIAVYTDIEDSLYLYTFPRFSNLEDAIRYIARIKC